MLLRRALLRIIAMILYAVAANNDDVQDPPPPPRQWWREPIEAGMIMGWLTPPLLARARITIRPVLPPTMRTSAACVATAAAATDGADDQMVRQSVHPKI